MANALLVILGLAMVGVIWVAIKAREPLRNPELMKELLDADRGMKARVGDGRVVSEDHAMDIGLPEDYKTPAEFPPGIDDKGNAQHVSWERLRGEGHPIRTEDQDS
ncbi:MAG: hypothetical protein JNK63_04625 [Chthonomonas sp.]|nr:hypothetical protein [Chthonomonas sp.]